MKKRTIIKISIIILISIGLIFIIFNYQQKHEKMSEYNNLIDRINNYDEINLYIKNKQQDYIDNIMANIKTLYNFKYQVVDINSLTEKQSISLLKKLSLYEEYQKKLLNFPVLSHVEKGKVKSTLIGVSEEKNVLEYLINNKLIQDNNVKLNYINDTNFKKENKNKNILVLYCSETLECSKIRKTLMDKNISHYVMYAGMLDSFDIEEIIRDNIDEYKGIMLIKFKDNKIISYQDSVTEDNVIDKISKMKIEK